MVNSEAFAKRLEQLFTYYDLNASSFAEKIEVGRASISHLLSGRNKPSLDFVLKVVQTFPEVELYWLLNGKGKFPKENTTAQPAPTSTLPPVENLNPSNDETPKKAEVENQSLIKGKKIKQIVLLYTDGTFETFNQA